MPGSDNIVRVNKGDEGLDGVNHNRLIERVKGLSNRSLSGGVGHSNFLMDGFATSSATFLGDDIESMFNLSPVSKPSTEPDQVKMVPGIQLRGGFVAWTGDASYDTINHFTRDHDFVSGLTLSGSTPEVWVYAVLDKLSDLRVLTGLLQFTAGSTTWADTTNGNLQILFKSVPFVGDVTKGAEFDPLNQFTLIGVIQLSLNSDSQYKIASITKGHRGPIHYAESEWNSGDGSTASHDDVLQLTYGFSATAKPFTDTFTLGSIAAQFALDGANTPSRRNTTLLTVTDTATAAAAGLDREFHYMAHEDPTTSPWTSDPSLEPTALDIYHTAVRLTEATGSWSSWFRMLYETQKISSDADGHTYYLFSLYPSNWYGDSFWARLDGEDVNEGAGRASDIDGALGKDPTRLQTLTRNTIAGLHEHETQIGNAYEQLVDIQTIMQDDDDRAILTIDYVKNGDTINNFGRIDTHSGSDWGVTKNRSLEVVSAGAYGTIFQWRNFDALVGRSLSAATVHGMVPFINKLAAGFSTSDVSYGHIAKLDGNPRINSAFGGAGIAAFPVVTDLDGTGPGATANMSVTEGRVDIVDGTANFVNLAQSTVPIRITDIQGDAINIDEIPHAELDFLTGDAPSSDKGSNTDHDFRYAVRGGAYATNNGAAWPAIARGNPGVTGTAVAASALAIDLDNNRLFTNATNYTVDWGLGLLRVASKTQVDWGTTTGTVAIGTTADKAKLTITDETAGSAAFGTPALSVKGGAFIGDALTHKAELATSTAGGNFTSGAIVATLAQAAVAGSFTDATRIVALCDGTQAGAFTDGTRTVNLADGTNAVTAPVGNIVATAGNITATAGDITAVAGVIQALAASVTAGTFMNATTEYRVASTRVVTSRQADIPDVPTVGGGPGAPDNTLRTDVIALKAMIRVHGLMG